MRCRIVELRDKQVVSIKDGAVIGYVCDIEFDTDSGDLTSIVVAGHSRGFGLLARNDDIVIPWDKIEVIGNDSILVCFESFVPQTRKKRSVLSGLFYGD